MVTVKGVMWTIDDNTFRIVLANITTNDVREFTHYTVVDGPADAQAMLDDCLYEIAKVGWDAFVAEWFDTPLPLGL